MRLTFTSVTKVDTYLATMETERKAEENGHFLDIDVARAPVSQMLGHTHTLNPADYPTGTSEEVVRLNGRLGSTKRKGPRKSLAVAAGDTIRARVWAKYLDLRDESTLTADMILAAIGGASGYTITTEAGGVTKIVQNSTGYSALITPFDEQDQPRAFLSWQFLPQNGDPTAKDAGYDQVTAAAAISNSSGLGNHEMLEVEVIIKQAGWINLELDLAGGDSDNSETRNIDIYFDDFEVNHHHGPIVQEDSYYPFGLTFNSYQREGGLENKYLFNGIEKQEDIDLDAYMLEFRMYDPTLGRFWQIDLIDKEDQSPYAWALNNPILYMDHLGLDTLNSNAPNFNWDNVKPGDVVDGVSVMDEAVVEADADDANKPADATKEYIPFYLLRKGDKVMGHRDGVEGLEDIFGLRKYGPWDVDAEGRIVGLSPITGVPNPWLMPGGAVRGIQAANGLKITGFTAHGVNRAIGSAGRLGVKPSAILDALRNPLKINKIVTDQFGRQSQRYIGQFGEVVVNPQTGRIISVNPVSTSKAAKLLRQSGR